MTPEERAFLRALAEEEGRYGQDRTRAAAKALLGALSVSGEAPTKEYARTSPQGPDETFPEFVARKAREYFEPCGPMHDTRAKMEHDIIALFEAGSAPPPEKEPPPETRCVEDAINDVRDEHAVRCWARKDSDKMRPLDGQDHARLSSRLGEALALYRTEKSAQGEQIEALRKERDDLERKGRDLCQQNGTLLMRIADALRLLDTKVAWTAEVGAALRGGKVERG